MHTLEPYYSWRHYYIASEDGLSPFFGREYNEIEFPHAIYNHLIHPQWDDFGSATLYCKILFVNYSTGYSIIELIGEWNDCLYNDIMYLKRNVLDSLITNGIDKFILIGENVLNFHFSDDSYYDEWFEEIEEGWIAAINFRPHVIEEFKREDLDYYIAFGGKLDTLEWRSFEPGNLYVRIESMMTKRLSV